MHLASLIKSLSDYRICAKLQDFRVAGLSCNSKQVGRNFLFVAIKGTSIDGHKFIKEAIEKGARAIVTQLPVVHCQLSERATFIKVKDSRRALADLAAKFYGYPSEYLKVVGITGTNGKTTITYFLEAILKVAGFRPGVIGTINYRYDNRIIPSWNTTPGPLELESLLYQMRQAKVDYAAMEVSSHSLDQDRCAGINFHSAIFTNLTQDHLDYHKTRERYFLAKAKLFENLSAQGLAVINQDDKYGRRLKKITAAEVLTYGIENKAKMMARKIKIDTEKLRFVFVTPEGRINLESPLIGIHNVYNILAAASWAWKEGVGLPVIKKAVEKFSVVPGRLEKIDFPGEFCVFVDYAHTEDALKNVLITLRQIAHKRIIVVFGCGGNRDKSKRPKMGRVVSQLADYAIITSDNPRLEDPRTIIRDIKRGIKKQNFEVISDRRQAIREALSLAKSQDIILVAGKGHETYQVLKKRTIPFNDCRVIRECLKLRNY